MPAVSTVNPSGIAYVDYVDSGLNWATNSFTYSFPTSGAYYVGLGGAAYGSGEENAGFTVFNAVQQAATASILNMYSAVANVTFTQITETSTQSATLRYAGSSMPSTAWGYYPSVSPEGGDAWFNSTNGWYTNPAVGNYGWLTIIHETGHLLGLKHPQDASGAFGAVPASVDSLEYTVMSYRSYIGASTTQGLTNATWSFPTTLMLYDIAALQYMYGANYKTNSGDTVYKWNPSTAQEMINGVAQVAPGGNTIFMTLWDGGGNDTYDFSNYTTSLNVNLQPGGWTTTSAAQLADLGNGHTAIGNIANAYLYNNNPASLIENAIGGTGNDVITGNTANNKLTGGAGNDTLDGLSGTDTAVYSGPSSAYQVTQNADGSWKVVDLRTGSPDGTDTIKNIEYLQFNDTTVAIGTVQPPPPVVSVPVISVVTPDTANPTDGITNAKVLTLTGTATANMTIKVYDGTLLLGGTVAGSNGSWSYTTTALADGNHSFTATATNTSGNTSLASSAKNVIVDTTLPVSPTIALQSADSGVAGDNITNVKVVSLTGAAEINSIITVADGATVLGSAVANAEGVWNLSLNMTDDQIAGLAGAGLGDSLGVSEATGANQTQSWAFTTAPLMDGVHNFNVTSTDAAGNVSMVSTLKVTIDTIAPNGPVIIGNSIVNANQVQLTGTAEAGSIVKLFDGTTVLGTVTANTSGAWNFTTNALSGGTHSVTATATDVAGNTGVASQALNAVIGGTVIEAVGSTSLNQVGTHFYLYNSAGSGPSLKVNNADVTVGQFGAWTPLGVEQTSTGYEIVWKNGSANEYIVWNTNNTGNCVSQTAIVGGTDAVVTTAETVLHQDLNGDGVVGVPAVNATVMELVGSTSLNQIGTHFYLYNNAGSGPSLKINNADVTAGQFGAWTPLGVEQTSNGYEVAWKNGSANEYIVWNTNNTGNCVSQSAIVGGTDTVVTTAETVLHQDLNGDGVVGVSVATVMESVGSTSLNQIGTHFYLYNSAGSGPSLKVNNADVTAGQFGGWTPVGVEQTSTGYEIAWKNGGANEYIVWNTNNTGNCVSQSAIVGGTDAVVTTAETVLHQDLNGDGVVGVSVGAAPANIVAGRAANDTLTSHATNETFYGNGGTNIFVFAGNFGKDIIADFQPNNDVVQLSHNVFTDFADVLAHSAQVGTDVVISVDVSNSVTLAHTTLVQLNTHNFHLV